MATKKNAKSPAKESAAKKAAAKKPAAPQFDSDKTVFLVDGSGYIFRAYYAIRRLNASDGRATNAVFGFTTMLLKVLREHKPKHIGIAFDVGGKTFRHELYPEYKGNRSAPPEDLPPQREMIQEVVDAFNIARLDKHGWEADDLIATVAKRCTDAGKDVVIITGDKDFMQLVTPQLCLLDEMRQRRGKVANVVRRDEVIADIELGLDDLTYEGPDRPRLRELFTGFEFKRLLSDAVVRLGDDGDPNFESAQEKAEEDRHRNCTGL